jgi:amino acid adenylation domain-containing protein
VTAVTGRSAAKQALLEQRLRRAAQPRAPRIPRRPDGEAPPLSFAQERLWFMEQFAPGTAAYGVPLMLRLGPDYDHAAMRTALRELTERHECLRMRFPATPDGQPTVVIDPPTTADLPVRDVADDAAAQEAIAEASTKPFDLDTGPLLRAQVLRVTGDNDHVVLLDMHHAITDGWSNDVLLADLAALYRARRDGGTAELPELPVGYGDFARWQRELMAGDGARGHVDYWLERLRGVPALELPTDAPRPATQTYDGASGHFDLDAELVTALTDLGRRHRATLFMVMLAGYQALLARYTRQSDFAVGTPVAGRSAPELDGVVGMFVNMLPLRCDLTEDPTVDALIGSTRDTVLDALAHQDVPFEKVINDLKLVRDVSRPPLFQTMFVLQNYGRPDQPDTVGAGTDIGWRPVELPATRYDLELHAYATLGGGLRCRFVYNTALFTSHTAAAMARHLRALLHDLVARPAARLSELRILDDAERSTLMQWGTNTAEFEVTTTLHELFEEQVRREPEATAVTCDGDSLSYRQLNARANRLAHRLRALGVGPDDLVAVCLDRGLDLVVAVLGVLKAGGGYVPLDPAYPRQRLEFIAHDTAAKVLLTDGEHVDKLPRFRGDVVRLDKPLDGSDDTPMPAATPAGLAYVIYTSGSSGKPKGVLVEHRQVVRLLHATDGLFDFGPGDTWALLHSYAFDFSVWEMWGALAKGGRLVVVPADAVRDHDALLEILRAERVTVLNQTPAAFRGLRATLAATGRSFTDLDVRTIVFGGDALHVRELAVWFAEHGDAKPALVNMYGITETTVHVTFRRITAKDVSNGVSSPIGRPLPDLRGYVLDDNLKPVPVGVPGELFVGGAGLARGYLNRPELTEQRFLPDPFHNGRMYRTGDLVRWLHGSDGNAGELEYLGRVDQQVKVRGHRIELGEVEAALLRHAEVRATAVVAREDGTGDRQLVGYVVPDGGAKPRPSDLRDHLARTLPKYMVPAAFVLLDGLPLTANGKLDRRALPAPDFSSQLERAYVEPETAVQRAIAEVWVEVLGVERVGLDDDFFALGGHSLLATQVVAKLRPVTNAQVGVLDVFQHPTVRGLAALIEAALIEEAAGKPRQRRLLHELTPRNARRGRATVCSYVCVPYGGGSAVVYQPIADAMPAGHVLYSVAIPGHDVGLDEDALPFDELVRRCVDEIMERVDGPLVLYGHCGVGGALTIELARQLEARGRSLEAVYAGGIFPFAKPRGRLTRLHEWLQNRQSNRTQANWLKSMGVDMDELDPEQADRIISNMRHDGLEAEAHFTALLESGCEPLRAPVISVVGERDPVTEFYAERYREWSFVADTAALVVLDEAGHFFLRYRAQELVDIITRTHVALARGDEAVSLPSPSDEPQPTWWLHGVARSLRSAPTAPSDEPTLRRFVTVATGQLVSTAGSALTAWAIPIWILQRTGSLIWFGLTGMMAFVPMLLAMPLAGAVADRFDRRKVLLAAGAVAASVELAFAAAVWTNHVPLRSIYLVILLIGFAATFQRVTFTASIPQLVPKRYLGHANGVAQLINGFAMLFVPLMAAGLLAAIGLRGILLIDLASYAFALTVLSLVRFPDLLGRVRRETFAREILGGLRISWGNPYFRSMLVFFAVGNLLYAGPLLLSTPLVLGFDSLGGVARVALAEGLGAMLGGITVLLWGGPRHRRMLAIFFLIALAGLTVALAGLRPNLGLVMVAMFGTGLSLAVADGIYLTIMEVKIPQRFHARVIALNQTLAWSTFPLGFALVLPTVGPLLEPLLADGGALAGTVGAVIGTGPGRGLGLAFLIFGFAMTANALLWLVLVRRLRRLDVELPDALPDDLVGLEALRAARKAAA